MCFTYYNAVGSGVRTGLELEIGRMCVLGGSRLITILSLGSLSSRLPSYWFPMLTRYSFACLLMLLIITEAKAGFVMYGPMSFNGHSYSLVMPETTAEGISWTDANVAANSWSFGGETGYLATITSAQENAFLDSTFRSYLRPTALPFLGDFAWISLTDRVTENVFRWETGESFAYSNWASGEPNSNIANEDYVHYWVRNGEFAWNDDDNAEFASFPGTLQG